MNEMIKVDDNLPDLSVKAIVKDEIKDIKLSQLFADHSLMHPKNKIKRVYRVKIQGILTLQHIQNLKNGVRLLDGVSRFDTVEQIKKTDKNSVIEVSTTSGKNRVVRRLLESQGKTVLRLKRIIYGPFCLD